MEVIATKYGVLTGISYITRYGEGNIKECIITEAKELKTIHGNFTPQYRDDGVRRKQFKPLSFHNNGNLKNISLQTQVDIETSIGILPAELITFYENFRIKRIFPLDGKLSGFWSDEDEYNLAREFEFKFSFGKFKRKIIGIHFYENGAVKSLTFWPKDTVTIQSPLGITDARIGISLYPDGKLKSFEPSKPLTVYTPIGKIMAYDHSVLGIHGDSNSLRFSADGKIEGVVTSTDAIEVRDENGEKKIYQPGSKPSMFNLTIKELVPMSIQFQDNKVRFNNSNEHEYNLEKCTFAVKPLFIKTQQPCSTCTGCSACG